MDAFGALADPVRRSILAELAVGPHRVADLAGTRPISRPAVSKHLRLLLQAGVVEVTDRGRERYYALDPAGLFPVQQYIGGLAASAPSATAAPVAPHALDALDTEVRRTSRQSRRAARATTGTSTEETA